MSTPAVPANLSCGFCKRPIEKEFYRTLNRFACANCAGQVQGVIDKNIATPGFVIRAAIAGSVVALGCAIAWGFLTYSTHFEFGIVASFIGVAVAKTVVAAAGKRKGRAYQILAAILSILGIMGGKVILGCFYAHDVLLRHNLPADIASCLELLAKHPTAILDPFDALWTGIAIYAAWRICQAPKITIVGPYAVPSGNSTGMQFQTMEPAAPNTAPAVAPPPPRQS
jgi:hypothetical protein